MSDKKRGRAEGPQSDPLDGKYSLEGTRYAGLQKQVKDMIRKQKGDAPNNSGGAKKKLNKKNGDFTKKSATQSKNVHEDKSESPNKPPKRPRIEENPQPQRTTAAVTAAVGPVDPKAEPFVNENTVYVAGLPFTASEEEVRGFFAQAGQVLELRLPRWHDSQK
eukprot:gene38930-47356_t